MCGVGRPQRRLMTGRKRARHRFIRVLILTIERFTSLGRDRPTGTAPYTLRATQSALTTSVRIERFPAALHLPRLTSYMPERRENRDVHSRLTHIWNVRLMCV